MALGFSTLIWLIAAPLSWDKHADDAWEKYMALQLLAGNIMLALIFADYASQFNLFNTCLASDLNQ